MLTRVQFRRSDKLILHVVSMKLSHLRLLDLQFPAAVTARKTRNPRIAKAARKPPLFLFIAPLDIGEDALLARANVDTATEDELADVEMLGLPEDTVLVTLVLDAVLAVVLVELVVAPGPRFAT